MTGVSKVRQVLQKRKLTIDDFEILLSDAASSIIEEIAEQSFRITQKFFGRTILLYVPLYLCNTCDNSCLYCGFNARSDGTCLSKDQVIEEAKVLFQKGFRHILLVSGEKRDLVTMDYLEEIISALHKVFDSVGLEIFPLEEKEYHRLFKAGADSLTIYQEVYDRDLYKKYHPRGPKSDYDFRLKTPERAACAGFYKINIGALLGLAPWKKEALALAKHAEYLKKKFWKSQISVSFPRLKESEARFKPPYPVTDRDLVQMICALRIFQPSLGLVVSTREDAKLRDNLITLGITQMSAESKTSPGAYSLKIQTGQQFEVSDLRSVEEVALAIAKKGYDPVYKDWDRGYIVNSRQRMRVD